MDSREQKAPGARRSVVREFQGREVTRRPVFHSNEMAYMVRIGAMNYTAVM